MTIFASTTTQLVTTYEPTTAFHTTHAPTTEFTIGDDTTTINYTTRMNVNTEKPETTKRETSTEFKLRTVTW